MYLSYGDCSSPFSLDSKRKRGGFATRVTIAEDKRAQKASGRKRTFKPTTFLGHASSHGELDRVVGCSLAFVFPLLLLVFKDLHPVGQRHFGRPDVYGGLLREHGKQGSCEEARRRPGGGGQ